MVSAADRLFIIDALTQRGTLLLRPEQSARGPVNVIVNREKNIKTKYGNNGNCLYDTVKENCFFV